MTTFQRFMDNEASDGFTVRQVNDGPSSVTRWRILHPLTLGATVYRYPTGYMRCSEHPGITNCAEIKAVGEAIHD